MATQSKALALSITKKLDRLRWLVAILGSKTNSGWWDCSFMDDTGIRFLANSFPRSAASAAYHATTEAAQRIHDAALGRIGCYHLFRMPHTIEDRLWEAHESHDRLLSHDDAMTELARFADAAVDAPDGPVQIGVEKKILTETSLRELAAHYHSAFTKCTRCYPYFSAES